jgi:hypothetical protein
MRSYFVHLIASNTMIKTKFKIMRLIILKCLYFIIMMSQLIWIIYISKEFINIFLYIVIDDS